MSQAEVPDGHHEAVEPAARYAAAHFPTRREREQTFSIAARLLRGERVPGGSGGGGDGGGEGGDSDTEPATADD